MVEEIRDEGLRLMLGITRGVLESLMKRRWISEGKDSAVVRDSNLVHEKDKKFVSVPFKSR